MLSAAPTARHWAWLRAIRPVDVLVAGTLALLLWHAAVYAFLVDDAFISFRYARNLASGHGLVFNPGYERVEGYTDFLWVVLLAGFYAVGVRLEIAAHVLSIAATIGLWSLVVWFVYRSAPEGRQRWLLPAAPLFLGATRSVAVWSTSGLETRLFELLVVGAVFRLVVEVEAQLAGRPRRPLAALLFALATLTRPDGLLVSAAAFGAAGLYLILRRRLNVRAFAAGGALFALLVGGHYLFRYAYYGQWFPNTYYAKVGGQTWWDMGLTYFGMFALEYAAYLWIPLLVAAVLESRRRKAPFVPLLFGAIIVPHAVYVAALGGDHFEYRPVDLYFPFLFILLYDGARYLARGLAGAVATAACAAVVLGGLIALPYQTHRQFPDDYLAGFPGTPRDSVASSHFLRPERDPLYRLPGLRALAEGYRTRLCTATRDFVGIRQEEHRVFAAITVAEGRRLRRLVDSGMLPTDTHLALPAVGAVPYYSDVRVLDLHGLTDARVAHSQFRADLRLMAHGKHASLEYVRQAGVDFWGRQGRVLLPITHGAWPSYLAESLEQRAAVHVAAVGEGYYLVGLLVQGYEHASRRFPRLRFRPLSDPQVWASLVQAVITAQYPVIEQRPNDFQARTTLAAALLLVRRHAEAVEHCGAALVERPDDAELWQMLARAYLGLRDLARATAAAEQALHWAQRQENPATEEDARRLLAYLRALPQSAAAPSTPRP